MAAATLPGMPSLCWSDRSREDTRVIGYYLGRVTSGIGLLLLVPLAVAIALGELNDVFALLTGAAIVLALGALAEWRLRTGRELTLSTGMVTVALAWLVGPAVVVVPLYQSGHYGAFVDALSGLTTPHLHLTNACSYDC